MEKFTTITSTAVPLPIEDVDTDQIIPARFLKATTREGFGENLFCDRRRRLFLGGSNTKSCRKNMCLATLSQCHGKNYENMTSYRLRTRM